MQILVLGGCGFIGSHIVDACLASGYSVSVIDHSEERFRPALQGVRYYYEDLLSIHKLKHVIRAADVVIHSISSTNPASSNANPEADVESNLFGMLRLLECMREQQTKRIIFLSSGGTVYGTPKTLPIPEDHPLEPQCSYAAVKLAIEHYLHIYTTLHDFQTMIIRPANPYGPRQWYAGSQGVIANFTANAIEGKPLSLWGTGNDVRDFFHVTDLARLCIDCITSGQTGIYNAGSGQGHSIQEIIDTLTDIHGSEINIKHMEKRNFDIPRVVLDIQKVQTDLHWQPKVELLTGMRDYYQWLQGILHASGQTSS